MSAWNPSDKSAGLVLSSTNHLATAPGGSDEGVRATISHVTDKYYLEMKTTNTGGLRWSCGFGLVGEVLNTGTPAGFFCDAGKNLHNAGSFGPMAGTLLGGWIGWAVDLTAKRGWARIDAGAWCGNGGALPDPATGVNGIDLSGVFSGAVAVYPICHLLQFGSAPDCLINVGDTAFAQAIPSGYTAWDATPPPNTKRSFSTIIN